MKVIGPSISNETQVVISESIKIFDDPTMKTFLFPLEGIFRKLVSLKSDIIPILLP